MVSPGSAGEAAMVVGLPHQRNSPYPLSKDSDILPITVLDWLGKISGMLSGVCLLSMALIMSYEIGARYLFNAPTAWATEISAYLLVAVVFFGLAAAQQNNSHVQVEIWIDRLSKNGRITAELVSQWIGLLFISVTAWQMASFNFREYVNGTRDWGLLSTPQWIPELPVSLGLSIFVASVLVDLYRLKPPQRAWRQWGVPLLLIILIGTLCNLGPQNVSFLGSRFDWGTLLILSFILFAALCWSGVRIMLIVSVAVISLSAVFWLTRGQSLALVGSLLVVSLLGMLLIGTRIANALGVIGLMGVYFLLSRTQLSLLAERSWSSTNTFTLTAVPMFILMGGLMLRSGIVSGMFDSLVRWFGRTPGGLAHASAGASAIFAAVSGSSLATAATLGKVACPEMTQRGYSTHLTYGVTGAGATLGILIPPSIPLIIYGTTVGASVTHLFLAGMIPGILLMLLFMLTALVWALIYPNAAPKARAYSMSEKFRGSVGMIPFIVTITCVLGSMYAGIATPTEAAAIGALIALLMCVVRKQIDLQSIVQITLETSRVTAMLLFIVVGAAIFSWIFDILRIPRELVALINGANMEPWVIMGSMILAYLILGMFVESIAMMLMTIPVTFPIAIAMGLDPIWFGIFLVLVIEIGLITPPLGMVLFVLHSMDERVSFTDIVIGILPFVAVMIIFIILLYLMPDIVLWLPRQFS
ncbi:TRAP transporter large permease subunit [Zwartia sp.]|uniref:TRAP transporter large permease n=1 Tax=Zwartia sp. TaxID=2978004 RepID=UPI00271C4AEF|nr:TRAP transporter large permease subunit [Zwartia sp.]MDO9023666.1 TRAP transporter large permease subunit [Zwartia sp.]